MAVVVLISGRGSNLRAILESGVGGRVVAVISDNARAGGLAVARAFGKPVWVYEGTEGAFEAALARKIAEFAPRVIALAGFMRVLSAEFVDAHAGRLVNVHPSLLPAYRGLRTHRRALADGARAHGCTVHWVNAEVDGGAVIAAYGLRVRAGDDEESLAARVLRLEHRLYPRVLARMLAGGV